jgi:hypothetical protein
MVEPTPAEPQLRCVEISGVAYVMASTDRDAEREVELALASSEYDLPITCVARLNRGEAPDPDWADALPLGEDELERTVAEIVAEYVPDQQDMERAGQLRLEATG